MADTSFFAECCGIKYVTDRVPPVEIAAEHPYMREIMRYDFDDPAEVADRLGHVVWEFDLAPEDIPRLIHLSEIAFLGDGHGS